MLMKLALFSGLFFSTCIAEPIYCPRAHEVFVDSTHLCYFFENSLANFTDASRQCQDLGYELVSFHSAYVNHYISNYAGIEFGLQNEDFWMGMYVSNVTHYAWTDKSKTNYLNWAAGEPVGDRHCGTVQTADGLWHTKTCSETKPFVCAGPPQGYATTNAPCVAVAPVEAEKCDCSSEIEKYRKLAKMFGI